MQPADHGSDYARMGASESTGYAKALLDCIDWLKLREMGEPSQIIAAGLRIAAAQLVDYRNAKLSAPMQPLLTRVELPHTSTSPPGGLSDA